MAQHLTGRGIASHVVSVDPVEPKSLESEPENRRCGLPRVPVSPPVTADPEPQLRLQVLRVDVSETDRADQRRLRQQPDGEIRRPAARRLPALMTDPGQGVVQLIGMGYGQCGVGDLAVAGQSLQLNRVLGIECPEKEARRTDGWRGAYIRARTHSAVPG